MPHCLVDTSGCLVPDLFSIAGHPTYYYSSNQVLLQDYAAKSAAFTASLNNVCTTVTSGDWAHDPANFVVEEFGVKLCCCFPTARQQPSKLDLNVTWWTTWSISVCRVSCVSNWRASSYSLVSIVAANSVSRACGLATPLGRSALLELRAYSRSATKLRGDARIALYPGRDGTPVEYGVGELDDR